MVQEVKVLVEEVEVLVDCLCTYRNLYHNYPQLMYPCTCGGMGSRTNWLHKCLNFDTLLSSTFHHQLELVVAVVEVQEVVDQMGWVA
jgi:hypothetical protein